MNYLTLTALLFACAALLAGFGRACGGISAIMTALTALLAEFRCWRSRTSKPRVRHPRESEPSRAGRPAKRYSRKGLEPGSRIQGPRRSRLS
jgi:hypothetical protein